MSVDIASLSLEIDSSSALDMRANQDAATESGERLEAQLDRTTEAVSRQSIVEYRAIEANQKRAAEEFRAAGAAAQAAAAFDGQADALQKLLNRYDPLGTKMRQLVADQQMLAKAMGDSVRPDVIKAFEGLQSDIEKTDALMKQAGTSATDLGAKTEAAGQHMGFASAYARRELLILGREVMEGNVARIPGTMITLAAHTGLFSAALIAVSVPILAVAAGAGILAYGLIAGRKEMEAMNSALQLTSNYAGLTRGDIIALATSLSEAGTLTIGTAKTIATEVIASGRYSAENVAILSKLIEDYAAATGKTAEKLAPELIKMFEDPAKASETLTAQYHYLSAAQLQHIIQLQQTGDVQSAATEAMKLFLAHVPEATDKLGTLEKWWNNLKKAVSGYADAVKSIGRSDTPADAVAVAQKQLDDLRRVQAAGPTGAISISPADFDKQIAAAQRALDIARQMKADQADAAKMEQQIADTRQKGIEAQLKINTSTISHIEDLKRERDFIIANGDGGIEKTDKIRLLNQEILDAQLSIGARGRALYDAQIAGAEKVHESQSKAAAEYYDAMLKIGVLTVKQHADTILALDLEVIAHKRANEQAILNAKGLTAVQVQQHKDAMAALDEEAKARIGKAADKQSEQDYQFVTEAQKAYDKEQDSIVKTTKALEAQIRKQLEHNASIGKTREQVDMLKTTQLDYDIVVTQARLRMAEGNEEEIAAYQAKLDLLLQLRGLVVAGAAADRLVADANAAIEAWKKAGADIAEALSKGFGQGGVAAGKMFQVMADGIAKQLVLDKKYAAEADKENKHTAQQQMQYQLDSATNQMKTYGDMADAAAQYFDKNSKGYAALTAVSKVFHVAELALEMAQLGVKAVSAILTQGQGDPYSAFFRMAAMAAIVTALLAGVGAAMSGGGTVPNVSAQRQAEQGTGSVLGDSTGKSDSIKNVLSMMLTNSDQELTYQSSMVASLMSIDDSMQSLAKAVAKVFGVANPVASMFPGIHTGSTPNTPGIISALGNDPLNNAINNLFFGHTTTSVSDTGLYLPSQSVGAARQGFTGSYYADVTSTHSGGLFGSLFGGGGSSTSRSLSSLDQSTLNDFTRFINAISTSIVQAVGILSGKAGPDLVAFGKSVTDFINGMNLPAITVSLQGLKGQDLVDALEHVFSQMSDTMTQQVIDAFAPGLEAFQRVGEGLFETLMRVASGVEKATSILDKFGIKIIDWHDIVDKTGDVALELVRQSVVAHETLNGVVTGVGAIVQNFAGGTADDLAALYQKLLDLRVQLQAVGADALSLTLDMIQGAGGLTALSRGLDVFSTKFFTADEQWRAQGNQLVGSFQQLGIVMPTTRQGFRDLLAGIDTTTAGGQRLYGALIALAPSFDQVVGAIDDITKSIDDMFAATKRNIALAGLDNQGKFDFYQQDAREAYREAMNSKDPQQIAMLSQRINDDINAAFGLLTPQQQLEQAPEWMTRLTTTQQNISDHLATLPNSLVAFTDALTTTGPVIKTAAETQAAAAATQTTAATTQTTAANTQLTAAQTPLKLIITAPGYGYQREVTSGFGDGG